MPKAHGLRFPILLLAVLAVAPMLSIAVADQEDHHDDDHAHATDTGLTVYDADFRFILRTALVDGGLAFIGVGGEIDGQVNPALEVTHEAVVEIVVIDGDGIEHDFSVDDFGVMSGHVGHMWETTVLAFRADQKGSLNYICSIPGHAEAGMAGLLVVSEGHD